MNSKLAMKRAWVVAKFLLAGVVMALASATDVRAQDCGTLGGTIVDGVCVVSGPSPLVSGSLTLGEPLLLQPDGSINVASPAGVQLTINAGGLQMSPGSIISAGDEPTCFPSINGGPITITANGPIETSAGSIIRSNGCSAGAISITATGGHPITMRGLVESAGDRTGTGAVQLSGGGPISIKAGCALTIANTARISSRGRDPGADLVHLEGCEVTILGVVESTGEGHAPPNRPTPNHCVLPGKSPSSTACVQIWSGGTILVDSTGGNKGQVNADIGFKGGSNGRSWIEIFAGGVVTIADGTGNDHQVPVPGNSNGVLSTFAVHANMLGVTNATGGLVNIVSTTADVIASGDAVRASGRPDESSTGGTNGGEIHVEAARTVTLDGARVFAQGDNNGQGGYGNGGQIGTATAPIRAFNGPLSWATGTGDAQPTGGPLTGGATGAINLQGCGSVVATASFPVTAGAFSPTISNACGGAPTLPSYVVLPSNCTCGLLPNGGISGTKWNDLNGNGVRDPADFGLSGWQIHLFLPGAPAETASTFTGDDGTYSFANLADGTYEVCESPTTGWTQTFPPPASSLDCQARTGGFGHTVTIAGGQVVSGLDFGNHFPIPSTAVKSGRKWNDLNLNGIVDPGEPGLPGWQIHLFSNVDPAFHLQIETDAGGNYSFTGLAPGDYTVCETVQPGWTQSSPHLILKAAPRAEQIVDCSDFPGVGGAAYRFLVKQGTEILQENDFGNQLIPQTGQIDGIKWDDLNGNGVFDPGEPGLPGWQIQVFAAGSTTALASTVTDVDGTYSFPDLPVGAYDVCESSIAGWNQTFPRSARTFTPGLDCQSRTGGVGYSVTLAPGEIVSGVTFGNHLPAADIRVRKEVDNPTPSVGDTVTFTVTVTNNGPDPATGVEITDQIPLGLQISGFTPSAGTTFDPASGLWRIGAMPVGFSATLQITARVVAAGTLTNVAVKTGGDQIDPIVPNNTDGATVSTSAVADIVVLKIVPVRGVRAAEGVIFTIVVRNAGPSPATGVVVVDRLPAGLTFVAATPSVGTYDPASGAWTIGDLAVDAVATMELQALLEVPDPVTNIATKTEVNEIDPVTANDSAGVTVNGQCADLQVVKTVDKPLVTTGDVVRFTVVVTNNGLTEATGVRVRDVLPPDLVFLSAVASQGAYVPETGFWDVGTLPATGPGSHATLQISARATVTGVPTNTAMIFASDQCDPNPSNNNSAAEAAVVGADLTAVVDEVIGNPADIGSMVDFFIGGKNVSETPVGGRITIALTIPDELEFMDMPQSGWDCVFVARTSFCTADRNLLPDHAAVAGYWTTVLRPMVPGTVLFGTVFSTGDANVLNNVVTLPLTSMPGTPTDLSVSQTVTPAGVGRATYQVTVTNNGPNEALDVTLTDVIPDSATLESVTPQSGACTGTRYVVCQLQSLSAGRSVQITFVLQAVPTTAIAHRVAVGGRFADPDLTNNLSSLPLVLGASPTRDTDADGMPDVWESAMGLGVTTPDAAGDPDGDGLSNWEEFLAGSHPRGFYRRFFAEGVTGTFFETHIAAMDLARAGATAVVSYMREDGTRTSETRAIGPRGTIGIDPAQVLGSAPQSFATLVESDQPIAADRLVMWGQQASGHAERGLPGPSAVWYFAEGATGAFDLFYLLQNSAPVAADVEVTFMLESSPSVTRTYRLEPHSRLTIWVNAVPGLPPDSQGAAIRASHPITAERAMYLRPNWAGGHGGAGASTISPVWHFAEGATGTFFDCFILVVNPNPEPAEIEARFARPDGQVVTRTYTVLPERRLTIWVDAVDPLLAQTEVATTLTATNGVGVVAERAMWWPEGRWHEGHVSLASLETSPRWAIPEAFEGGPTGSQTYVLVSNADTVAGRAAVTVRFANGRELVREIELVPSARVTVPIGATFPQTLGQTYSVVVESLGASPVPLTVECARYWSGGGRFWSAGVSALATPMR